jgi:hypothetical protein
MSVVAVSSRVAVRRRVFPWAVLAGVFAVIVAGLLIKAGGGVLGVPLPPFVMRWEPLVDWPLAVVAAVALGAGVLLAPVVVLRVRSRLVVAVSLYALALGLGLALNAARVGDSGWSKVFATGPHGSVEGYFEYLLALPVLRMGIHYYVSHFAALLPYVTTHVKGNPPGPLIALHLLGISTPGALAALCIGLGSLSAPLAYDLGRVLGGERRGRVAGLLTAFSPALLLFGVTSADYAFTAIGVAVACLLVRAGPRALIAGSILAAIASFFSWLLLAIPAWAAVVTWRRHGWGRAAAVCAGVAIALVAFTGLLAIVWGYDPFSALSATAGAYSHGIATIRPYAFWVFGSPAAWIAMLGAPVAWFSLRALSDGDDAAVAIWGLVALASVVGFTKAETERVWLPFVPLACVAAAGVLAALPVARLRVVLAALAVQALAVELLFFTVW